MKRITRTAAATLAATATVVASAAVGVTAIGGTAFASKGSADDSTSSLATQVSQASTPPRNPLATIQAKAAAAIAVRQASLSMAITDVTGNAVITDDDRAALLAILNDDATGLAALGHTIAADTTSAQATSDYRLIFTEYRVYALALPQVRFAAGTDDITGTVIPKLTAAESTLRQLLSGTDSGKNTPAVQAAMSDLATQIDAMTTATSGLSGTVLAYTPAQYDANHALLTPARQSLKSAASDAKAGVGDVKTIVKALR